MSLCNYCSATIRKFILFAQRQTIAKPGASNKSSSLFNKLLNLNIDTRMDALIDIFLNTLVLINTSFCTWNTKFELFPIQKNKNLLCSSIRRITVAS